MKKLLMATVATIALTAGGDWAAEPTAQGGGAKAEMKGQAAGKAETTGSGAAMWVRWRRYTGMPSKRAPPAMRNGAQYTQKL